MIADKNLNEEDLENNEKMEEKIKKEEKTKKRINDESIEYSRIINNKNNLNLEIKDKISVKEIAFNYIDPFFNQIAKQYDEGGSKGLLLNNIKKDKNLIYILYNQKTSKNLIKSPQLSKKNLFQRISIIANKFHLNSKNKIISKDLGILKEKLLKVGPSFNNLIKKEFTLDINTSMIQITDNFYNENNFGVLEKDLFEEINCTQIRLSENPILMDQGEDYDIAILDDNENGILFEENKEDNEKIFFDLQENINEFKSNFEEESFEENLFDEDFHFWDYLEPNKESLSFLKRKKKNQIKKKNIKNSKKNGKKEKFRERRKKNKRNFF